MYPPEVNEQELNIRCALGVAFGGMLTTIIGGGVLWLVLL